MKNWLLILLLPLLVAGSCKGKKKNQSGSETIEAGDFIGFFHPLKLPVQLADSSFHARPAEAAAISYADVRQFVPDSLLHAWFGRGERPKFYPIGRVEVPREEIYLFSKAISPAVKKAVVFVFNHDKQFVTGMPLLTLERGAATRQSAMMDSKYTITTNLMARNAAGATVYRKSAWVFNDAGVFTLILTESNDAAALHQSLVNPIDTLPGKNKLSGDYMQDKRNIVSIRDGRRPGQFFFYIHFEKDGGECRGDLKGQARIIAPGKAVFQQQGDPCIINFSFSGSAVTIHEEEGCGSHRDIKCFFEGRFTRKNPPKKAAAKKRKH